MGGASTGLFVVWFAPDDFPLLWAIVGAAGGAALGLPALIYLVPLLCGTRLRPSLTLVFGVCTPLGIVVGAVHPLFGAAAAFVAQIISASIAAHAYKVPGSGSPNCNVCGYPLANIVPDFCPECGAPALNVPDTVPGFCPACRAQVRLDAEHPRCPECGAVDLNLLAKATR